MVLVLVKGSNTLRVHDQHLVLLAFLADCDGFVPDPEAFGAWVDSRTDTEPTGLALLVEQDSIQQEALARPIFPCHSDHAYLFVLK